MGISSRICSIGARTLVFSQTVVEAELLWKLNCRGRWSQAWQEMLCVELNCVCLFIVNQSACTWYVFDYLHNQYM